MYTAKSNSKPQERILRSQKGQGLIEYLLLTALLAIGTMAVVRLLGNSIAARYADVINAVQGVPAGQTQVVRVQESQYKKRDMSDFMQGATTSSNGGSGGGSGSGGEGGGNNSGGGSNGGSSGGFPW